MSAKRDPGAKRKGIFGSRFSKTKKSRRNGTVEYLLNGMDSPSMCQRSMRGDFNGCSDSLFGAAVWGNLNHFERIYERNNTTINSTDDNESAPIHLAAINGHVNIVEFILSHGGDKDLQNVDGNTALHLAVEKRHHNVIKTLIDRGADTEILNGNNMAPVHHAIELDFVDTLEVILKLDKKSAHTKGAKGTTPLHHCASNNRSQCAELLLKYGAKPCAKCNGGEFPIHLAANSAAAETLNILVEHVQSYGYSKEMVLSFTDKYNNTPLHSAVNGGDIEAVRVCINAGAAVDVQQEDKSTPLHFACAQGSLDKIQLMKEMQPDKFRNAMKTMDVLNMTPLHRAAMFNHTPVVQYLIDEGADKDALDDQGRTPLLLSASKGSWDTVHCLLENGADISVKDKSNRNFLHLAIMYGICLTNDRFSENVKEEFQKLLNEKDNYGCTPLHYASEAGHLVCIDDLINMGALINARDNEKQSPLHFAARYGRINTCRRLLNSKQGASIINECNGKGLTALHIASQHGHTKIINLLMQKGANITRTFDDNTPLHMAAENGYVKSMRNLLGVHANLLDTTNKNKDTALHLAAEFGQTKAVELLLTVGAKITLNEDGKTFLELAIEKEQTEVALAVVNHQRWEEALNCYSPERGSPVYKFIQYLPEVCLAVLDRCKTKSGNDEEYDFKYLQCSSECLKKREENGYEAQPLYGMNMMVRYGRVECLSHPVCKAYLAMKWKAYGLWIHTFNLILYIAFVGLLTYLVTMDNNATAPSTSSAGNSSNGSSVENNTSSSRVEVSTNQIVLLSIVLFLTSINIIKEFVQLYRQRLKYLKDITNVIEWILYISTILFVVSYLNNNPDTFNVQRDMVGAIAVFLAWFNFLLFLQRFDWLGIYVVMFLEILATLLKALFVFSILIVAFGLAFNVLMRHESSRAYQSPLLSIVRTAMMMLELDYMASFSEPYTDGDQYTLPYGELTMVFLAIFVLLMPILLINLLIGLAVGDIEAVRKNARLKRLAMQVELHTDLERWLPECLLQKYNKEKYKTECKNNCFQIFNQFLNRMTFDHFEGSSEKSREVDYLKQELYKQKTRLRGCRLEPRRRRLVFGGIPAWVKYLKWDVKQLYNDTTLKEISSGMDKQYDLLRLIVQKMEIQTEDDNRDEGVYTSQRLGMSGEPHHAWKNVLCSTSVISRMKSAVHDKASDC